MRTLMWMGVAAAVWTGAACRGEPIGDVLWWEEPLFAVEDVDVIDRAAKLSPEQRRAMEDLMLAGMAEARRAAGRARQRIQDREVETRLLRIDADESELRRIGARNRLERIVTAPGVLEAERKTLEEARSLLTGEQQRAAWEAYERYRVRRAAVSIGAGSVRGADPLLETARRAGLSDEEIGLLGPVRAEMEMALDALATRVLRSYRAIGAEQQVKLEREARGEETDINQMPRVATDAEREQSELGLELYAEMSRAHVRGAEVLPDGARAKFNRARAASLVELIGLCYEPITGASVVAGWRCRDSLTPEQARAIGDLAKAAWEEHLGMGMAELKWYDDSAAVKKGWVTDQPLARWQEKSRAVMERLRDGALAVLTPEQRARANSHVETRAEIEAVFERRAGEPSR